MSKNVIKLATAGVSVIAVSAIASSILLTSNNTDIIAVKDTTAINKPVANPNEPTPAVTSTDVVADQVADSFTDASVPATKAKPQVSTVSAPVNMPVITPVPAAVTPPADTLPVAVNPPAVEETTTKPAPVTPPITTPAPVHPQPVEPKPQPSFTISLREEDAYVQDLSMYGSDRISVVTPFDIIHDEGYVFSGDGSIDCKFIDAPTDNHGVLCHAGQKEADYGMLAIQFDNTAAIGYYAVEVSIRDGETVRSDILEFEIYEISDEEVTEEI